MTESYPTIPRGWRKATSEEMNSLPTDRVKYAIIGGKNWARSEFGLNQKVLHRLRSGRLYIVKTTGYGTPAPAIPKAQTEAVAEILRDASRIPDTGARTAFTTGAVRDASVGKGIPSRIPPIALHALAVRFEDGAIKYPDGEHGPNWMQGIPLSRFYDAVERHKNKAAQGHTDEDHFGAMLWNAAAWLWTENEIKEGRLPAELNDLPFHPQGPVARHRNRNRK